MMKYLLLLLTLCTFQISAAQNWTMLSASPTSLSFRHDDVYFVNDMLGYVCNVDGRIYRTTNGGTDWQQVLLQTQTSFRSIGFTGAARGFCGNLGPGRWSPTTDTQPLYQTADSGNTWTPVTAISGTMPEGICGISIVNDSVIWASGRVGGPAYMLKSTNGGSSWTSIDMNSIAHELIDCKFLSADTGVVTGAVWDSVLNKTRYAMYYTSDGGDSWYTTTTGSDTTQLAWKVFFTSRNTGYVAIESFDNLDSLPVLKTTDGGWSWSKKLLSPGMAPFIQGIGFMDDNHGWCGGFLTGTWATTDAGETWFKDSTVLFSLNRIRRVNDTLGFAVGKWVWKFTGEYVGTPEPVSSPLRSLTAFPNPFHENFTTEVVLDQPAEVELRLYDLAGRPVQVLLPAQTLRAGTHRFSCELPWKGRGALIVVANTSAGTSAQIIRTE